MLKLAEKYFSQYILWLAGFAHGIGCSGAIVMDISYSYYCNCKCGFFLMSQRFRAYSRNKQYIIKLFNLLKKYFGDN